MSTMKQNLLKACMITCFAFAITLLMPTAKASATTGGYYDDSTKGKYTSTIYYDVDNSCDYRLNGVTVDFRHKEDSNGHSKTTSKWFGYLAQKSGKGQKLTFTHDDPIINVQYVIEGDFTHICKFYLTKITTTVTDQVEGCGIASTHTLWEGKCGMKMAPTQIAIDDDDPDGDISRLNLSFWGEKPEVSDAKENKHGTNVKKETDYSKCDLSLCGDIRVAGMTSPNLIVEDEIAISTEDKNVVCHIEPGIFYNQYGMKYHSQYSEFWVDSEAPGRSTDTKYDNGNWTLVLPPMANAPSDYNVKVIQYKQYDMDTFISDTVKVKVFDYKYTFMDQDGNVIKESSVAYDEEATPPDRQNTWVCEAYPYWKVTTNGPQIRKVKSMGALQGSGTEADPFLIQSEDDWNQFAYRVQTDDAKGDYFRLEDDITVKKTAGKLSNPFEGVFDGNGKTLTVDYTEDNYSDTVAPFACIRNATIKNLNVAGNIKSSRGHIGGIVGETRVESTISDCTVSATLEGGNYVAGISVGAENELLIENCTFEGLIKGNDNCGGFVACGETTTVVKNGVFKPAEGSSFRSGATFVNGKYKSIDDCIFYTALGVPQGDPSEEAYQDAVDEMGNTLLEGFRAARISGKKIRVWWKQNKTIDGVQIRYSTDRKFKKNVGTLTIDKQKTKTTIRRPKRTVYIKIRAYRRIKNPTTGKIDKVYTRWTRVIKIKKRS